MCNGVCSDDKYEFPEGYLQFDNVPDRIACLQIPAACLEILSTKGLLETCLGAPYRTLIFLYNDYQTGFDKLVEWFNMYQELLKRPDLINTLIEKYASIGAEVPALRSQNNIDKGSFSNRLFLFEFILTQDVVVENLSAEQEQILILLSFENKELINNNSDIFSGMHHVARYLLYAKIMRRDNLASADMLNFIRAPQGVDQRTANYLDNYVNNKLK